MRTTMRACDPPCSRHPPSPTQPPPNKGEYIAAGDLLEAEQGKAMALKRSVAEMERRVSEMSTLNAGLGKELTAVKWVLG